MTTQGSHKLFTPEFTNFQDLFTSSFFLILRLNAIDYTPTHFSFTTCDTCTSSLHGANDYYLYQPKHEAVLAKVAFTVIELLNIIKE